MMPISAVHASTPVLQAGPVVSRPVTPGADSLLPAPMALPANHLEALLALQTKSRQRQFRAAMTDVRNNKRLKAKAFDDFKKALKKAQEAKKKGGFWKSVAKRCGKLGKYAAVAAAIAIAVGTGGAGAPATLAIIGAVMSSAALVQSETQILQKMGVSDKMAGKIELGLSIGGAVCTGGAGMANTGAAGAEYADKATSTMDAVQGGAQVAQGAAKVAEGVATIEGGKHDAEAAQRHADATKARIEQQRLERMFTEILEMLEESEKSEERSLSSLRGAIEARDGTSLMIARRA